MKTERLAGASCVALVLTGASCAPRPPPGPAFVWLGGDAARVGASRIPASLVDAVARARGIPKRLALDGLIQDALLELSAHDGSLDAEGEADWACAALRARLVVQRLQDEARAAGPPSDGELARVRVVHAVVLRSPSLTPAEGRAAAEALLRVVADARSPDDFADRVRAWPHPGVQLHLEGLDAFDASGRLPSGESIDPTFVAAALALDNPGETSGVVPTPFGWHVIRLVERADPEVAMREAKREELAPAVVEVRARLGLAEKLGALRQSERIDLSPGADALLTAAVASRP